MSCTAVSQGNILVPIEGTAFATNIYVVEQRIDPTELFLMDWETGERVDEINLSCYDTAVYAVGRSPKLSTGCESFSVSDSRDITKVSNAGGLLFITPKRCGMSNIVFYYDSKPYACPIIVCVSSAGHSFDETVVAREPEADKAGISVHFCSQCGTIYREQVSSYGSVFSKFKDVSKDQWYYNYVKEAVCLNLFKGVSKYEFKPEDSMTRAMLVTVLWRYEGEPDAGAVSFADVPSDNWCAPAVAWAAEQGIVNGVGGGRFDPDGRVTREQIAVIFHRYAQKRDLEAEARKELEEFSDESSVSAWAAEALSWAVADGLITGSADKGRLYLLPQNGATRAQLSAILVRFIENMDTPPLVADNLDFTQAVDSGFYQELQWAYYPDGTLRFAGNGTIPSSAGGSAATPWQSYSTAVRRIEILSLVSKLEDGAFKGYSALEKVWIADSVLEIGKNCFQDCITLEEIRLSSNTVGIDDEAFKDCHSMASIDLPHGMSYLGDRAFQNCIALKAIEIPDSITEIDEPSGQSMIPGMGRQVFYGCSSLEKGKLPVALTRLPDLMFQDCTALKEVIVPACAYHLGFGTFYGCESLESFVIPAEVGEVKKGMFTGCTNLKEVFVLNPEVLLRGEPFEIVLDKWPYGDPTKVILYGFADSTTQSAAEYYGYTFVDIETLFK